MVGCVGALIVGLGVAVTGRAGENLPADALPKERTSVDIGMPKSLFQGMPEWMIKAGAGPFKTMMKNLTGIDGVIQIPEDAMKLAGQLDAGSIQIGVMQGHEYAWAKSKYPNLVPIAVAVPMDPVQSFCVVRWNCEAANIGELKNGKISLPPIHRHYCDLYLSKIKDEHMKGANFAGQLTGASATDTISQVINSASECAIVDCATYEFFKVAYPGQFKCIKVLCQSEVFPNACIVVNKGDLNPKTIDKFTKALLKAENDPVGKPMLGTWKLNGFAKVPDDYEQQIKNIQKAYPMPPTLKASIDK
jgi:ABC-type phosphate/phosphonate transport system substrate-binding protein